MKLMEWLASTIVLSIIASKVTGDLMCLSCKGIPQSSACPLVEKCGSHSVCYIDMEISSAGSIYFNMGCREHAKCSHRRRNADEHLLDVVLDSSNQSNTSVAETLSTADDVKDHELNYSKQSREHIVQRRDKHLTCSVCCNSGNLCNVKGCGQSGFMQTRGPICYACDQQLGPNSCQEIKVCGRDEMCYIEEVNMAQITFYHTTCRSKLKCLESNMVIVKSSGILIGRDVQDYRYTKRNESNVIQRRSKQDAKGCCNGDMCNTVLPQNGNWGPWAAWGVCSASCGYNGIRHRYRRCEFPPPDFGGLPCIGDNTEIDVTCANSDCQQGMVCLNCQGSVTPKTCNYVEICGPNSVCYLDQYVNHVGEVRYQSGCRDKMQCENGVRRSKRFMINGDYLSCSECCVGDLCNSHGCGEPFIVNRGPVCYSCSQQLSPEHCNKIDICDNGQNCGLLRHQFMDTFYETKCLDKEKCVSDSADSNTYPKCCTTSLCTFSNRVTQSSVITPTRRQTTYHGFTTAPTTELTTNSGYTTPGSTSPTKHGFTTAPQTSATKHGFTTAPQTSPTKHGFTTAPQTSPTKHGFTTAPQTSPTKHGFTTAPQTSPTKHGFTTAPHTLPTKHGFTTAPQTSPTKHGFTTAPQTSPTKRGFTTAPSRTPTTNLGSTKPMNQALGQWSEWSEWGPCLEPNADAFGIRERYRYCDNPNHTPPDSCTNGHTEHDQKRCSGGGTDACIPAQIIDIMLKGTWELQGTVMLKCVVTGYPTPDVQWLTHTKVGVQQYFNDPAQIIIGPIQDIHRGLYKCEASNRCSKAAIQDYNTPDFRRRSIFV